MRIEGTNQSLYTYQNTVRPESGNEAGEAKVPGEDVAVILELSHVSMPSERKPKDEEISSAEGLKERLSQRWKALREWAKQLAEKTKELWSGLAEKLALVVSKIGNLWATPEKQVAEQGVLPVTWQENFRRRVKILFDAVAGFLSGHLPTGNGNFAETREEEKEEDLYGEGKSGGKPKESDKSTFDVRG